ncbi:MAG: hypothetical protein KDD82_08085 [Planctomycetes bacterium]|nr:hypothetical protein [Planctomycetota bacterium]
MRVWIAVGAFVAGASLGWAQPVASEHELLARKLITELGELGFAVDGEKLAIEVLAPHACEEDVNRQQDLFFRPSHFTGVAGLLSALVDEDVQLSASEARLVAVKGALQSIAAYYQWDRNALVFPRSALNAAVESMGAREALIAHELAHAYQAQRPGGLEALVQSEPRWTDRVHAAHALMEGECELIAMKLLLARKQRDLDAVQEAQLAQGAALEEELSGVGSVVYDLGRRALLREYKRGGWEAVQALVKAPPGSTEQLIHPAKLGADTPTEVPPQALAGWVELHRDVVGELQTYMYLRKLGVERAGLATCGWEGDCLQVLRNEARVMLVVWRTLWDSELDAQQFLQAIPAKGRARRAGRWVDLVWSNGPGVAEAVRGQLAAPPEVPQVEADVASTREAERELAQREADAEARRVGDRWVIPAGKLVLRLPVGWTTQQSGVTYLAFPPRSGSRFRDNVNVQVQPNPLGTDLDAHVKANAEQLAALPDMTLDTIVKGEAAGRPVLKCTFTGVMNLDKLEFECWIFPREQDQVVITTTALGVREAKLKQALHQILESVEFED